MSMDNNRDKETTFRNAYRLPPSEKKGKWISKEIIVEQAVTIAIEGVGEFTFMCTPSHLKALAVGFACSEGLIESMDDVIAIESSSQKPGFVALKISDPSRAAIKTNMVIASGSGMGGGRQIEKTLAATAVADFSFRFPRELLGEMSDRLFEKQQLHPKTRGSHAAGFFTEQGDVIAYAEDIGRHNALDKAIGESLLEGISIKGLGVVLSSRASFEMVSKAARAGVELVVADAVPSSLAIEAADKWHITLCGPTRKEHLLIHTHPRRILVDGIPIDDDP
jgi:FdhD protein